MSVEVNGLVLRIQVMVDLIQHSKCLSLIIEVEIRFSEVEIKIIQAQNGKSILILFYKTLRF